MEELRRIFPAARMRLSGTVTSCLGRFSAAILACLSKSRMPSRSQDGASLELRASRVHARSIAAEAEHVRLEREVLEETARVVAAARAGASSPGRYALPE